jgi:hypothetical protein
MGIEFWNILLEWRRTYYACIAVFHSSNTTPTEMYVLLIIAPFPYYPLIIIEYFGLYQQNSEYIIGILTPPIFLERFLNIEQ